MFTGAAEDNEFASKFSKINTMNSQVGLVKYVFLHCWMFLQIFLPFTLLLTVMIPMLFKYRCGHNHRIAYLLFFIVHQLYQCALLFGFQTQYDNKINLLC